jgi:starch-binding outer membrane protein, SusD/RagB family
MAFGFQRTQFYAPGGTHGTGWGDGKARRWLVDEFLKERRVDGRNDLRLYNSILYKHFGDDFPDQSKKYYANEDASQWFDEVRERAGLSKLKDSRWKDCLSSKEVFIKRLQMERALELCFEGWRWADLKRWGLLDSQAGIDELKARDKDFNNFVIGKHKRMPIPTSEVEISKIDDVPQLTQNPNY